MSCFCPVLNSLLRPRRIVTMYLGEKIYVCITCRISIYVVYMSVLMCVPFTHTNLILINLSGASRVLFFVKSIALFTAFTAGRGLAVGIKFFLRNPARCERSCEQFFFSPGIDAFQAFLGPCYLVATWRCKWPRRHCKVRIGNWRRGFKSFTKCLSTHFRS